uniref:Uncharacterized protein n=1 Tax=Ralstonia solanacearum TaxID=305 RepID=A0A0S4VUI5_RALSL|nr:protein of unknown function [Ralstonia solanacearum]CUV43088.1 protein of unknown function [Ralstonia solanacearum]
MRPPSAVVKKRTLMMASGFIVKTPLVAKVSDPSRAEPSQVSDPSG